MHQNIPNKPSWMSDKEWAFILDRDGRRCFQFQECLQQNGFSPCHGNLDKDHRQPQDCHGDDSFANLRLACLDWNRGRPVEPDAYWQRTGWFDSPFFHSQLRDIQLIAGYDQIVDNVVASVLVNEDGKKRRNDLIKTTTLLPGATGIGKTMLTLGVLFAINQEVNKVAPSLPRVSRVLWLSTNMTLRDHTGGELETEPVVFGLTNSKPDVSVAKSFATLENGPVNADITVACPQALWEMVKGQATHSEDEVRKVLAMWDTIVFDECDFANEQAKRLCRIASHALKFWVTASPMVDGEFLRDCVLISNDAVADYQRAQAADKCLKKLSPRIEPIAEYGKWEGYFGGDRQEVDSDSGVGRDHAACVAAVLGSAYQADNLERTMQRVAIDAKNPDEWYSPHIIVRLERIEEIKQLLRDLPPALKRMKDDGLLKGDGWNVEAVYQGSKNVGLGDKFEGEYRHPFMMSRNNKGQAIKKSARILLMAEIGTRGINNWPISYVVDTTSTVSITEMIQFNIGRPIRWPGHLSHWINDKAKDEFTTTKVVCLSDLVERKQPAYAEAHKFVMEQRELLAEAGFNTWQDIANGKAMPTADIIIDPSGTPFTEADKMTIRVGIGDAINEGVDISEQAAIDKIVCRLIPKAEGKRRERALDYADRLIYDPEFRELEVPSGTSADVSAVGVIAKLKPQETYDVETLKRFVQWKDSYAPLRDVFLDRLETSDLATIHSVSEELRRINEHSYREIEKNEKLSDVVNEIARELFYELNPRGTPTAPARYQAAPEATKGDVISSFRNAAKKLFGMEDVKTEDDGPMDKRPYHVAIQVRYRQQIKNMTIGRLAARGLIPAYTSLRKFR